MLESVYKQHFRDQSSNRVCVALFVMNVAGNQARPDAFAKSDMQATTGLREQKQLRYKENV